MKDKVLMKKLWATARNYGVDSELLHSMAFEEFGKEHISELTDAEARALCDKLSGKAINTRAMTEKQKKYIGRLLDEKFSNDKKRIEGWFSKFIGTVQIETLTKAEASKAITMLKKL